MYVANSNYSQNQWAMGWSASKYPFINSVAMYCMHEIPTFKKGMRTSYKHMISTTYVEEENFTKAYSRFTSLRK